MTGEEPISYLALKKGTPVLTNSGSRFGTVEHVLSDDSLDLFDGVVVRVEHGVRFLDAGLVGTITTEAVQTTISDSDAATLPQPDGEPVFEADPEEYQGKGLTSWYGRMFLREHWMRDRPDSDR